MAASSFVLLFFIMFHLLYLTGGTIALATIAPMVVFGNVAIILGESTPEAVDREGFGSCSNQNECEAVCPKRISVRFIAALNREYLRAGVVESGLSAEPESPHAEST